MCALSAGALFHLPKRYSYHGYGPNYINKGCLAQGGTNGTTYQNESADMTSFNPPELDNLKGKVVVLTGE